MPLKDLTKRAEYQKKYHKEWYLENKEKRKDQIKKRKKEIKKWFRDLKSHLKCSRCPENHIACLDFHHKDQDKKVECIANMVINGISIKKIKEEIKKCEILCSNCHRKERYDNEKDCGVG